jgi:hypothetical protein
MRDIIRQENMDSKELNEITGRLDKMIALLEVISKPQPLAHRIVNGLATGAGILGILGAIEVIRSWMIGG